MRTYVCIGDFAPKPWRHRSRPGRAYLAALLAGLLLVVGYRGVHGAEQSAFAPVIVEAGETLWSIAVRERPDADPRGTIDRIIARNGLHSPALLPGQRLEVPRR
jgi:LysM repeat protein